MITIENIQKKENYNEKIENIIKEVIEKALEIEEFLNTYEVNILLVDNAKIREINKEHRNIDKSTDVLSFPMVEYGESYFSKNFQFSEFDILPNGVVVLGDIVLSLERAKEQSIEYGHSLERELAFLICHSVMHLLGHDHLVEDEKKIMREKEENVLQELSYIR